MESFIWTSALVNIAYLFLGLAALCTFGFIAERAIGLDLKRAINNLEKAAEDGDALPLAIVLAAVVYLWASVLPAFIS